VWERIVAFAAGRTCGEGFLEAPMPAATIVDVRIQTVEPYASRALLRLTSNDVVSKLSATLLFRQGIAIGKGGRHS
jgi:hypothetical protein